MISYAKDRISSIDYFRSFAILAVIILHESPFLGAFKSYITNGNATLPEAIIELLLRHMVLFAVPFFLVVAGYFFSKKIQSEESPILALRHYLARLIPAWIFWIIFYLLTPAPRSIEEIVNYGYFHHLYSEITIMTVNPLITLFEGGAAHLWFFPVLIVMLCIVTFFSLIKKRGLILFFAILLYSLDLLISTYSSTPLGIEVSSFLQINFSPMIHAPAAWYYSSLIFVYIGGLLAENNIKFSLPVSVGIVFTGLIISSIEIIILWKQFDVLPDAPGLLIGTVPSVSGIVMSALSKPKIGISSFITKLGRYTLGVYAIHYIIYVYVKHPLNFLEHPFSDIFYPFIIYISSLTIVVAFSKNRWLKKVVV